IDTATAARAVIGIECPKVMVLEEMLDVKTVCSTSDHPSGNMTKNRDAINILKDERDSYDAVALATKITPPHS
ncbi:unnamed protein product, partial [Choristocarpus tenellus]